MAKLLRKLEIINGEKAETEEEENIEKEKKEQRKRNGMGKKRKNSIIAKLEKPPGADRTYPS